MSLYPTVYNQNSGDEEKDGGLGGLDLGLDDLSDESPNHTEYADGEEESNTQTEIELVKK